jgi:hypothetical protein
LTEALIPTDGWSISTFEMTHITAILLIHVDIWTASWFYKPSTFLFDLSLLIFCSCMRVVLSSKSYGLWDFPHHLFLVVVYLLCWWLQLLVSETIKRILTGTITMSTFDYRQVV